MARKCSLTFACYIEPMKAFALVLVLLTVGDVVFDHGAGVVTVGRAGQSFAHSFAQDFSDSLFAA